MNKKFSLMLLPLFSLSSCGNGVQSHNPKPSNDLFLIEGNSVIAHYLGYGRSFANVEYNQFFNLIVATASYDNADDVTDEERITVRLQETLEYVNANELGYELNDSDIQEEKNYINTLFNVTDATRDTSNYSFKDDTGSYAYMKFETGVAIPAQEAFAAMDCDEISNLVFDVTKKDGSSNEGISGATGTDIDQVNPGNADNWSLYLAALQDVAVKACETFEK